MTIPAIAPPERPELDPELLSVAAAEVVGPADVVAAAVVAVVVEEEDSVAELVGSGVTVFVEMEALTASLSVKTSMALKSVLAFFFQ